MFKVQCCIWPQGYTAQVRSDHTRSVFHLANNFTDMKQMDVLVVNILGGESTTAPVCEPRYILTQWKPPLRRDKTTWQYI